MKDQATEILKQYINRKSKYFSIADGDTVTVKYISAAAVPNNFDGGKTMLIRYELEVAGITQYWDRPSRQLAQEMLKFPSGSLLSITRKGQKNQTTYSIAEVTK